MCWFVLAQRATRIVDLASVGRRGTGDKDLEILLLRHRLRLLQRQRPRWLRLTHGQTLTPAVLTTKLAHLAADSRTRLDHSVWLVKPDTVP